MKNEQTCVQPKEFILTNGRAEVVNVPFTSSPIPLAVLLPIRAAVTFIAVPGSALIPPPLAAAETFPNWSLIDTIIGSDIDQKALEFASKNLSLLTLSGMDRRIAQITAMIDKYNKESHRRALVSAHKLRDNLRKRTESHQVRTHLFRADATVTLPLQKKVPQKRIDIVFADVPYGRRSAWHLSDVVMGSGEDPVRHMLDVLHGVPPRHAIVAIASSNRQKVEHDKYDRLKQLRSGKCRISIRSPGT